MSQWTHVNACIRFDDLRLAGLGKGTLDMKTGQIPEGSEGPLQFTVIENPDLHAMAAYVALVWGDLRDFGKENVQQIIDYLNAIVDGRAIRSGIAEIDVEYSDPMVLRYDDEPGKWVVQ